MKTHPFQAVENLSQRRANRKRPVRISEFGQINFTCRLISLSQNPRGHIHLECRDTALKQSSQGQTLRARSWGAGIVMIEVHVRTRPSKRFRLFPTPSVAAERPRRGIAFPVALGLLFAAGTTVISHAASITGANGAAGSNGVGGTSGAGGNGGGGGNGGVAGATGGNGTAGSGGTGGGGGGGGSIGNGGAGGSSDFGTGGAAGTIAGPPKGGGEEAGGGGAYGGSSGSDSGGGGGGGGARGGTISTNTATIPGTDSVAGGAGGKGGNGAGSFGDGGAGGGGGIGVVFTGADALTVNGTIAGGNGGAGGDGGGGFAAIGSYSGNGGSGGTGLRTTQGAATVTVNAAVTGGSGGASGISQASPAHSGGGSGGAGIIGASTIVNNSTIGGGSGGAGAEGAVQTASGGGGGGGIGGAGGIGLVVTGIASDTNSTTGVINGGNGGAGGMGGNGVAGGGRGGNGGTGGIGLSFTASGATFANQGTIAGGAGGTAGAAGLNINTLAVALPGNAGAGGAGVSGSDLMLINSGTISGGLGGNGVTRANAITFTGGTNRLELRSGSTIVGNVVGTGGDTLALGGATNASFDVSAVGAAQQYRGFNALLKSGTSNWTITGVQTDTTAWVVDAGTLSVNGNIASSSGITVNAGGTLGGNGTVGNTIINGGALAPGNSIGLLTVQGNLVFTAAASYMVEVSPANADRVNVTGTAILGGATVNAAFSAGSYVVKQYTIVNAASGVIGTFGSQVNSNLPANFVSSLSYDSNNAYLNLTLAFTGFNANQQSVGNALANYFNRAGGMPLVFGGLNANGLTQASGEAGTGAQQATFDAMNLFIGLLTDPFTPGRGFETPDALGYTSADPRNAHAAFIKAMPRPAAFEPRWNVWAAGYGGSQTTGGNATLGSNNASSSIGGVAVGADIWLTPNTVAGFALAGGGTSFAVANLGSGRSDLFQAGASIRHGQGSAYLTAAAAYGWQDITTDRTVTIAGIDRLRAEYNANSYSARVEGGNRYAMPWVGGVGITPYAAVQVTSIDLPTYAETANSGAGTFVLNYASKTATGTRSELGIRHDKSFAVNDAILTLRGRAAWAHDFNTDRSISATFQALPGAAFVVNGASPAHDTALTTVSAEIKFSGGISLAATFEGEFCDVTRSFAGKGVARYQW
jgi:uncharacterized protein with beta-barrel porin domain